jgi:4'-phosphopantetheinyl transferase
VSVAADSILWLLDAGALPASTLAAHAEWLGEGERQRLARFVRPLRRRQFIAGRALLRLALAHLPGVAPQSIMLEERPGNAPLLAAPALPGVGFSISHSGPWVACAVSVRGAVGLDIECIDPGRDVLALADQALGAQALAALQALEGEGRIAAFYEMWCLHEAAIKLGRPSAADHVYTHPGLALALCSAEVQAAPRLELVKLQAP